MRRCKGDEASQWRKPKFDPLPRPKYKSAQVITSWTPTPVQKLVTICPGVSSPRMRDFAHKKHVSCLVFLVLATRYSARALDGF